MLARSRASRQALPLHKRLQMWLLSIRKTPLTTCVVIVCIILIQVLLLLVWIYATSSQRNLLLARSRTRPVQGNVERVDQDESQVKTELNAVLIPTTAAIFELDAFRGAVFAEWKDDSTLTREFVHEKLMYWKRTQRHNKPGKDFFSTPKKELYITFEIDRGGFNNIRMQLEILVILALITQRTFVLTRPEFWYLFKGQSNEIGLFFDVDSLKENLPVITMREYLTRHGVTHDEATILLRDEKKIHKYLRTHDEVLCPNIEVGREVLVLPDETNARKRSTPPNLDDFLDGRQVLSLNSTMLSVDTLHFRSDYEQHFRMLGVACTFFYFPSLEWERYYMAFIRDHFHYTPHLFELGSRVVHKILTRHGRYNAIHVRRNDFQFKEVFISMEQVIINVRALLHPDMPLFVATDETDLSKMAPLRAAYPHVLFLADFQDELLDDALPNELGMVDQIICTCAERFVGTDLSTFSANINRMRGFMERDVAPDKLLYVNTDLNTGSATRDGWRTFATWMKQEHLPQWKGAYTWAREFFMSWELQ